MLRYTWAFLALASATRSWIHILARRKLGIEQDYIGTQILQLICHLLGNLPGDLTLGIGRQEAQCAHIVAAVTRIDYDGGSAGTARRIIEPEYQLAIVVVEGPVSQEASRRVEGQGDLGIAARSQRAEHGVLVQRLALGNTVGIVEVDGKGRTGILGTVRNLLCRIKDHIGELAVAGDLNSGDRVAARCRIVGNAGDVVPVNPDTRSELVIGVGLILILVDQLAADGVIQRALGQREVIRLRQVIEGVGREGLRLGRNNPDRGCRPPPQCAC